MVKSITVSPTRVEVNGSVAVNAVVEDQETAVDKLLFEWSSEQGTFSGTGLSVTWRAPVLTTTPVDYPLKLTVIEPYLGQNESGQIVTKENRVTAQVTVRIHNSPAELGNMGVSFLTKFANSSISPEMCVVDFTDTCRGKQDEIGDIRANRDQFLMLGYRLGTPSVSVGSPFDSADMVIPCSFDSRVVKCPPGTSGCVVGAVVHGDGNCSLTGRFERERWWLCDSHYTAVSMLEPMMRYVFGPSRTFSRGER